jgi:hypothetical protein
MATTGGREGTTRLDSGATQQLSEPRAEEAGLTSACQTLAGAALPGSPLGTGPRRIGQAMALRSSLKIVPPVGC